MYRDFRDGSLRLWFSSSFKRLKDTVINPAVAEVNRVSDFRVTADYQRDSRKNSALSTH